MKKLIYIPLSFIGIVALLFILGEIQHPGIGKHIIVSLQPLIFQNRINQMFKENMNLINRVFNICETISDENKAAQEINAVMNDYATLLKKYSYLNNQRLTLNNEFGRDWAGTMHTQWMQTVYTLNKTIDSPQKEVKQMAINIILNSLDISFKQLNQHISAMLFLDEHATKPQPSME